MPPLTDTQLRTLTSVIDRIIPEDDYPSASSLGCVDFLVKLIALEDQVEFYQKGLDDLNREALALGTPFWELSAQEQDGLLFELERSRQRDGWEISPREFISLLARQTIEGYYSDPGNGGNRDEIAWKMLGFAVTA